MWAAVWIVLWMPSTAAARNAETSSHLSVVPPPGVPSEKVHITHAVQGGFRGYGDFVRPIRDLTSYSIPFSVQGKGAASIRMVLV